MDLDKLVADLQGRPFSMLAVSERRADLYGRVTRRRGLILDWVDDEDEARELLAKKHYDLVIVKQVVRKPRSTTDLVKQGRKHKAGKIIVAGDDVYRVGHLRAILDGADAYAPSEPGWRLRLSADRQKRPDRRLQDQLKVALSEYGAEVGPSFYRRLRSTVAAERPPGLDLGEIIESAVGEAAVAPRRDAAIAAKAQIYDVLSDTAVEAPLSSDSAPIDSSPRDPPTRKRRRKPPPAGGSRTGQLFWNSRFPGNVGILRNRPHLVAVGGEYPFETALEPRPDPDAAMQSFDSAELEGKPVAFHVEAENGEVRAEGTEWSEVAVSSPKECTPAGTDPFRVTFRPKAEGEARIDVFLVVDNGCIARQRIDLAVWGGAPAAAPATAKEKQQGSPVDSGAITGAPGADYRFHLRTDGARLWKDQVMLPPARLNPSLVKTIGTICDSAYADLKRKSQAYRIVGGPDHPFSLEHSDEALRELAVLGAQLHARLFLHPATATEASSEEMKGVADELRNAGGDGERPLLQILADEYPVPWGLLYDRSEDGGSDLKAGKVVDPEGFWGRRFDIYRSVRSGMRTADRGARQRLKPVIGASVPRGGEQRLYFDGLRAKADLKPLVVDPSAMTTGELQSWAQSGTESDLLYFFCHARPAELDADYKEVDSSLGFGSGDTSGDRAGLGQLRGWWKSARLANPVVFMNACSSGQNDMIFGTPFVDLFAGDWQGQAFVGTDWPVNAALADLFGRRVIEELLDKRVSLRDALRNVSNAAADDGNYFPLMYAIYGPNNVRFVDPEVVPAGASR